MENINHFLPSFLIQYSNLQQLCCKKIPPKDLVFIKFLKCLKYNRELLSCYKGKLLRMNLLTRFSIIKMYLKSFEKLKQPKRKRNSKNHNRFSSKRLKIKSKSFKRMLQNNYIRRHNLIQKPMRILHFLIINSTCSLLYFV